jgi:hypothetical protein
MARVYAEAVVDTIRQPLLTLDAELRPIGQSCLLHARSRCLRRAPEQMIYELGNGQWNTLALRKLFEDVLPENTVTEDFVISRHPKPRPGMC